MLQSPSLCFEVWIGRAELSNGSLNLWKFCFSRHLFRILIANQNQQQKKQKQKKAKHPIDVARCNSGKHFLLLFLLTYCLTFLSFTRGNWDPVEKLKRNAEALHDTPTPILQVSLRLSVPLISIEPLQCTWKSTKPKRTLDWIFSTEKSLDVIDCLFSPSVYDVSADFREQVKALKYLK